jgi:hypothetical protein
MIIDEVYRGVNQLISKYSSGGYLSDTEFNNYAYIVQNEKLETDLQKRKDTTYKSGALSNFKRKVVVGVNDGIINKPSDFRYFETATSVEFSMGEGYYTLIEELTNDEFNFRLGSELDKPTLSYPCLTDRGIFLEVSPKNLGAVDMTYIINPPKPVWGFAVVNNRKVFNENASVDFTYDQDDVSDLIYRIAKLTGIEISDTFKYQSINNEATDGN